MTYTPKTKRLGLRRLMHEEGLGPNQKFKTYPQCPRQFKYYGIGLEKLETEIKRRSREISSSFEELTKTLELVSDPIARLVLSKRIAADLAGRGIEVNFGESYG